MINSLKPLTIGLNDLSVESTIGWKSSSLTKSAEKIGRLCFLWNRGLSPKILPMNIAQCRHNKYFSNILWGNNSQCLPNKLCPNTCKWKLTHIGPNILFKHLATSEHWNTSIWPLINVARVGPVFIYLPGKEPEYNWLLLIVSWYNEANIATICQVDLRHSDVVRSAYIIRGNMN